MFWPLLSVLPESATLVLPESATCVPRLLPLPESATLTWVSVDELSLPLLSWKLSLAVAATLPPLAEDEPLSEVAVSWAKAGAAPSASASALVARRFFIANISWFKAMARADALGPQVNADTLLCRLTNPFRHYQLG